MGPILIKNIPEDLLKELRKLKVDLECRTWSELLAKLVESEKIVSLSPESLEEMRSGVQEFLRLGDTISKRWKGSSTVLDETRRARRHENA